MKPIIGLSLNVSLPGDPKRTISKDTELYYLQKPYVDYVRAGGGTPVLIPVVKDAAEASDIAEGIDGLLLIGGIDVEPQSYGETNTNAGDANAERDRGEMELVAAIRKKSKPLFGICRGMQIINTAFRGTLIQDIPSQFDGALRHHRDEAGNEVFHQVLFTRKSFLIEIFEQEEGWVNSSHHQSIGSVGVGLTVLAAAKDGIIEAVECPDDRCTFAVQWHPERMLDDDKQIKLINWFVSKAS